MVKDSKKNVDLDSSVAASIASSHSYKNGLFSHFSKGLRPNSFLMIDRDDQTYHSVSVMRGAGVIPTKEEKAFTGYSLSKFSDMLHSRVLILEKCIVSFAILSLALSSMLVISKNLT